MTAAQSIPPIAHAISGSLGSTLGMLLLYPLERVRIEMAVTHRHEDDRARGSNAVQISSPLVKIDDGEHDETDDDAINNMKINPSVPNYSSSEPKELPPESPSSSSSSSNSAFSFEMVEEKRPARSPSNFVSALKQIELFKMMHSLHLRNELYKGSTPVALTIALSNFIFFYTLQYLKAVFNQRSASFSISTVAGIVNVLLTNPFWVANLRIVNSSEKKGILRCIKDIIEKEGLSKLWSGTGASLLLVSNPAIQYYFYEKIKGDILRKRGKVLGLKPVEAFVLGAISKGLATVATYPLQLAQVLIRLQKKRRDQTSISTDSSIECKATEEGDSSSNISEVNRSQKSQIYKGVLECMLKLYMQGGITALYAGMNAKLLQSVLTSALTFLTYEEILSVVARGYWALQHP